MLTTSAEDEEEIMMPPCTTAAAESTRHTHTHHVTTTSRVSLATLDAVDDIMHIWSGASKSMKENGYKKTTVDPGAAEVGAPLGFAADYRVKASAGS